MNIYIYITMIIVYYVFEKIKLRYKNTRHIRMIIIYKLYFNFVIVNRLSGYFKTAKQDNHTQCYVTHFSTSFEV